MKKTFFSIFFILFVVTKLSAQVTATGNYCSPVDVVTGLSGTFGELRSNHFHSGIDIRTQGSVGKNIYAIADGYVSRISVSPFGYGKTLYITHYDGKSSVYAHLMQFKDTIAQWVIKEQYKRQSFSVNLFLELDQFPVKKGEIIALSGNSGSSGGPHLHFEIRDNATGMVLNALKNGFTIPDKISPTIRQIVIYPNDSNASVNHKRVESIRLARGKGNNYKIDGNDTIQVWGNIYFGVDAVDRSSGSTNANGINFFKIYIDKNLVFSTTIDEISFDATRDINSFIDYAYYKTHKTRFIRSKKQPGNRLKIYDEVKSNGIYNFEDKSIHEILFEVGDAANNISKLKFWVKSEETNLPITKKFGTKVFHDKGIVISEDQFILTIPQDALYDDATISCSVYDSSNPAFLSPVFSLGDNTIPLKKRVEITLFPDQSKINHKFKDKLFIANINNGKPSFNATTNFPIFMTANVFELGKYTIMVDTIPPTIKAENIWNNKDVSHQTTIRIKIKDDLSGIKHYNGTLNNQWILMEYDAKENLLEYTFDEWMKPGNHKFVLKVSDEVGNESKIEMNLKK